MTSMLSEREREVAALLLDGITYRDIGARLFIPQDRRTSWPGSSGVSVPTAGPSC